MSFGPHVPSHGPKDARIFLLAEAPGPEESAKGIPLVGPPGYELRRMLRTVGVNLDDCYKANVFSRQPEGNLLGHYCSDDPQSQHRLLGPLTNNPLGYMDQAHAGNLTRLHHELQEVQPNVVVGLGNTATWALGLGLGISALRGSIHSVDLGWGPFKVLPTFHPSAILRDWSLRTIAITDLEKAAHESQTPSISYDNTELWLNPILADLREFDATYMQEAKVCASDIETKRGQITAISFSPSPEVSLAIPFWLEGPDTNYWGSVAEEKQAWSFVRHWLERADLVKVFQNGLYDLQYLHAMGFKPRACIADTMLAHHSLYSELQKGLGFLGSIYANVPMWKNMRTFKKEEALKRDD